MLLLTLLIAQEGLDPKIAGAQLDLLLDSFTILQNRHAPCTVLV